MLFKLLNLITGFTCGYLLIGWVPIQKPFNISNYISEYIFNPLKFFVIMICFFIGFLSNSILIRKALEETIILIRNKVGVFNLLISYCFVPSFYILFQLGFWQTLVLLCFSLIYGIISIDIERNKTFDRLQ